MNADTTRSAFLFFGVLTIIISMIGLIFYPFSQFLIGGRESFTSTPVISFTNDMALFVFGIIFGIISICISLMIVPNNERFYEVASQNGLIIFVSFIVVAHIIFLTLVALGLTPWDPWVS